MSGCQVVNPGKAKRRLCDYSTRGGLSRLCSELRVALSVVRRLLRTSESNLDSLSLSLYSLVNVLLSPGSL